LINDTVNIGSDDNDLLFNIDDDDDINDDVILLS